MTALHKTLALLCLLLCGALFGFFYAWVCSTMWGLDATDPRVAIAAMQAMNGSVRNAVFAPVFFGTPIALLVATVVYSLTRQRAAALFFGAATLVVALLAIGLTMMVHIPLNEALAEVTVPGDIDAARVIWEEYSPQWQFWNQFRTMTSGLGLLLAGIGLRRLT